MSEEKCIRCGKPVYVLEMMTEDCGPFYCEECRKRK